MTKLYIDIETIPSQEPWVREYIIDTIKPPGNIKKQESIDAWYAEKMEGAVEEAMHKTSFDGAMCQIIAIGYAVNDDEPKCFYARQTRAEGAMLSSFFAAIESLNYPTVVGHNVSGFDLRVIRQRSLICGVGLASNLPWSAKPWDINPYDTMVQWDAKNNISLDKLAKAFGVEGKGDMSGSMVYDYWKAGLDKEIIEYCKADVALTREVAKKMMRF